MTTSTPEDAVPAAVAGFLKGFGTSTLVRAEPNGRLFFAVPGPDGGESLVKLVPKAELASFALYIEHLRVVGRSLRNVEGVLAPEAAGEVGDYVYVQTRYLRGAVTLSARMGEIDAATALRVMAGLAERMHEIHRRGFVHADLKPDNVLLSGPSGTDVSVIDFGMVAYGDDAGSLVIVGAYRYLPPALRTPPVEIGPYIDLYALGVIGLEMLSGSRRVPSPVTHQVLAHELAAGRMAADLGDLARELAAAILVDLLSARERGMTAEDIAARLRPLIDSAGSQGAAPPAAAGDALAPEPGPTVAALERAIKEMGRVAEEVEEQTRYLVLAAEGLTVRAADQGSLADEMRAVFTNATARARQSWVATVAMTLVAFALLIALVVTAAVMTVVTRSAWWGLLLGGASFTGVFGYLIWKPFDRLFQATMIVGQLEMIHLQAAASLRTTEDAGERSQIYQRAIAALEELRVGTAREEASKATGKPRGR